METYLACNDHNLFFSEEENSTDVNKYYVPQDEGDSDAVDDYITVLSAQVPDGARVLDVGCAQGKFGRVLSKKGCVLWGVDINQASIQYVREQGYYQNAFVCDVTCPESQEFRQLCQAEKFDVILLSDVLEHLADPTAALLRLYPLLSEKGCFLVGIPNVANLDICFNLLEGRFNYSSMGILDNTHLKFFTKDSFAQWIALIGKAHPDRALHCTYLGSSYYESDYVKNIKSDYPNLFHIVASRSDYNAFQLFFRLDLKRQAPKRKPAEGAEGPCHVVSDLGAALEGKVVRGGQGSMPASERELLMEKIEKKETWIAQQEELLQYSQARLKELEAALAEKDGAVAQKDAWIVQQEEFLKYRETQLKELEAALDEKDKALAQKDGWITKQEEFLKYREAQLKELEAALGEKDTVMAQKDETIAQKDAWIAQQEEFLQYRQTQLKEKEAAIADLDEQVRQLNEVLETGRAQLAQKEEVLADQAETIELLRVELDLVKQRLAEIENSRLWRMTRFLHH